MCKLVDLSFQGLIRVSGPDARDFLQTQFCNDVAQIDETRHQLNGWCNPKGRLLAVFRLFVHEGVWVMRMPIELLEPVIKRLRMFVLRSNVTIEDASDTVGGIGLWGTGSPALLAGATGLKSAPAPGEVASNGTLIFLGIPENNGSRFEIYGATDDIEDLKGQLSSQITEATEDAWRLREIQAGLPTVYPSSSEQFVPQMVNMDLVDALSFSKGCYPGQEIVARTRYLGKLKRRMFRLSIDSGTEPEPGQDVYSTKRENAAMGTIVDAAPGVADKVEALAVLRLDDIGEQDLHIGEPDGPAARIEPLPYDPMGTPES
ncbi:MAG: folate-binding protein [Pseudomonadota bacterium]|nr:folate-binding protein [Pseudomonadota bacterium]